MNSKLNSIVNKIIEFHLKSKKYKYSIQRPTSLYTSQIPFVFPKALIDFQLISNGATFYNYDDIDGYKFYSIEEIIKTNDQIKDTYQEGYDKNKIVFCEIIGEGNYIAIDSVGNIYDGFHEIDPVSWSLIEESLSVWLEKVFENEGRKYWL